MQTDWHTNRLTQDHRDGETDIHRWTDDYELMDRYSEGQTKRPTDIYIRLSKQTHRFTDVETRRYTYRSSDIQTGKLTDGHTDRPIDSHTCTL